MLVPYTCYARCLLFFCTFWHISATDFDLQKLYDEKNSKIEIGKEDISSTGVLYLYEYPEDTPNVTFTLNFPKDYAMVIGVEYLRLSKDCDAFVEISNPSIKMQYCRSTLFHNYGIDTLLLHDSPVELKIAKMNISSSPELELRYTVMTQNHSCGDGLFKCDSGYCIWKKLECNGYNNCGDESDELGANGKICSKIHQKRWNSTEIIMLLMVILVPMSMLVLCTLAACVSHRYAASQRKVCPVPL